MMTARRTNRPRRTARKITRREALTSAAAAGGLLIVGPRAVGAKGKAPSDRLAIAGVGLGVQGCETLRNCGQDVVAVCDVDAACLAEGQRRFPDARAFTDFRRMLDKAGKSIDAVVVSTPDHTHGVVAAAALRAGKHVYCQAPLAHDVWEARELARLADEAGAVTQMGNETHSGLDIRRSCEHVWAGDLGEVTEARCWSDYPVWPQGMARPGKGKPAPEGLNWDLWLGPAAERAFHDAYHPYDWRGWVDFGTGALGAVGCDTLNTPFWALKLGEADRVTVEAETTGCNGASWPKASTVRWRYPAREAMPPVTVVWYDGGRRPSRPEQFPDTREHVGSSGVFLIGSKGMLATGPMRGGTRDGQAGPRMIPEWSGGGRPKRVLPRVKSDRKMWVQGSRHENEWVAACKAGKQPCSAFAAASGLTEMALLGNVAILAGEPIEFDRKAMKITNRPAANRHLRREYRTGWKL